MLGLLIGVYRLLRNILKLAKNKHSFIRIKCTEYMLIMLKMQLKSDLEKFLPEIQAYFKTSIQDSHAEVRKRARVTFLRYCRIWPDKSRQVLHSVEASYQKAIEAELRKLDIDFDDVFSDS